MLIMVKSCSSLDTITIKIKLLEAHMRITISFPQEAPDKFHLNNNKKQKLHQGA